MNVLEVQSTWNRLEIANMGQFYSESTDREPYHVTLAVNDARRKQLYYALYGQGGEQILPMNIASASDIDLAVHNALTARGLLDSPGACVVDIIGHGATRYEQEWQHLPLVQIREESVMHNAGAAGVAIFAASALTAQIQGKDVSTDPLYLRRPDVTIPAPSKHILGQTAISMRVGDGVEH